jgi:hypothetical protein
MKPLLISLALLCAPACVLSQGVVAFRNDNLVSPPNRLVCGPDGTPLTGTTFAAQLLYGTDPTSLQPHPALAYFRAPTTSSPGTWSGGNRTLTGIAAPPTGGGLGPTIWLQVAAWDAGVNRTVTFDQARAGGAFWSVSLVFSYTQALSSPPNPTEDTKMHNFVGFDAFICAPEPSAVLLLVPSIALVWLLKRRTKHSNVGP